MASEMEFIEYVVTQMEDLGNVRYRKMFGDCMIYLNERPVILVCDNTTYVKKHPAIEELMRESETGIPYEGAKEYYIIDAGHKNILLRFFPYWRKSCLCRKKTKASEKHHFTLRCGV